MDRILTLALIMSAVSVVGARAQLLLDEQGVQLHGTAQLAIPGGGTCNVLESDTSYEAKKANHGKPMDVWRLDFSVSNRSGRWLDHLVARLQVASEWPACTNWSEPDPVRLREAGSVMLGWTDTSFLIQESGRNVVAPGATLTGTKLVIVLRGDPDPRFASWSVNFDFGSGRPPGSRTDARTAERALALDRPTRRLIQRGLRTQGFDPGAPDGLFGPATRGAIRSWQASRGLAATGYLDSAEAAALQTGPEVAPRPSQPPPEPAVDAQWQVGLRTTLRRMARSLARARGPNRVSTGAPPRREPEAEARPAEGVQTEPPEPTSTRVEATGFCGLPIDARTFIVVSLQWRGWREDLYYWYSCDPDWSGATNFGGGCNSYFSSPDGRMAEASRQATQIYGSPDGGAPYCTVRRTRPHHETGNPERTTLTLFRIAESSSDGGSTFGNNAQRDAAEFFGLPFDADYTR